MADRCLATVAPNKLTPQTQYFINLGNPGVHTYSLNEDLLLKNTPVKLRLLQVGVQKKRL